MEEHLEEDQEIGNYVAAFVVGDRFSSYKELEEQIEVYEETNLFSWGIKTAGLGGLKGVPKEYRMLTRTCSTILSVYRVIMAVKSTIKEV